MGCRYHGLGNMKSRGYLRFCLYSVCHCLLRLFGETLSFEMPASTQSHNMPSPGMVRKAWRGWKQGLPEWLPQEDLLLRYVSGCDGQLKIHGSLLPAHDGGDFSE